jgi:hypothetical protein
MIPLRKNVFHTLKQLRAHARHWHVQLASAEENSHVLDTVCCTDNSDSNCSYTDKFDDVQQLEDISRVDSSLPSFLLSKPALLNLPTGALPVL